MSVNNVTDANALFLKTWNDVARQPKKPAKSEQQKAMEMFGKAVQNCEKASERMMDKHLESVAKSAKELAVYHKRKAVFDRMKTSADEQKMLNEKILLSHINQRNMLQEMRVDDINRQELLKASGQG
jgi:hypothetical protein